MIQNVYDIIIHVAHIVEEVEEHTVYSGKVLVGGWISNLHHPEVAVEHRPINTFHYRLQRGDGCGVGTLLSRQGGCRGSTELGGHAFTALHN